MEREFLALLTKKLMAQATMYQTKAKEETNSLTSAAYNMQGASLLLLSAALVETFNELN